LVSAILGHTSVRQQLWITPCSQLTVVWPSTQPSQQVWLVTGRYWFPACRFLPAPFCHMQQQVLAQQQQLTAAAPGQRQHQQPTHPSQGTQMTPHSTRSGMCDATDLTLMWIPRCAHTQSSWPLTDICVRWSPSSGYFFSPLNSTLSFCVAACAFTPRAPPCRRTLCGVLLQEVGVVVLLRVPSLRGPHVAASIMQQQQQEAP
jgi:hypothetical protein